LVRQESVSPLFGKNHFYAHIFKAAPVFVRNGIVGDKRMDEIQPA
jgi:hypothetical protein